MQLGFLGIGAYNYNLLELGLRAFGKSQFLVVIQS